MSDMIYFDNSALTPPCRRAIDAFADAQSYAWANPNSPHAAGEKARDALENARETMLQLLGAGDGDKLIFTSGASESAAIAMNTLRAYCNTVVTNPTDHHCVTQFPFTYQMGHKPVWFGVARMLWNNETGERLTFDDIPYGSLWACDLTAGVGHAPFAISDYPNMTFAFGSAQKFGGITGVGFLLVRRGAPLVQMIHGAPNRGGTPPVALIAAMSAALEDCVEHMDENSAKVSSLREKMLTMLRTIGGVRLNLPDGADYLPHILNVAIDGVDGKTLAMLCSNRGVMISAGSACTSGDNAPSHVLVAMYHDERRARSSIRISFSPDNTDGEVEQAAKVIAECVAELRALN